MCCQLSSTHITALHLLEHRVLCTTVTHPEACAASPRCLYALQGDAVAVASVGDSLAVLAWHPATEGQPHAAQAGERSRPYGLSMEAICQLPACVHVTHRSPSSFHPPSPVTPAVHALSPPPPPRSVGAAQGQ